MTTTNQNWQSLFQSNLNSSIETKNYEKITPEKPYISFIDSQSVLEITGVDAGRFLQGQCSADIEKLEHSQSVAGCICTVKGRVLSSFVATKQNETILLRMPKEIIANLHNHLKKYAAFYKVEIIEWHSPCVISTNLFKPKTDLIKSGYSLDNQNFTEYLIEKKNINAFTQELNEALTTKEISLFSEQLWQDQQIDAGWLNLTENMIEEFLPHQLNLEKLGAIDFKKGCYTGQEIIARTEYRGKPKRRLHRIKLDKTDLLKKTDIPFDIQEMETEKTCGKLLSIGLSSKYNLAILHIENSGEFDCLIGNQKMKLICPKEINIF